MDNEEKNLNTPPKRKGHMGPGMGGALGEKAKDLKGAILRLVKELKTQKVLIIISLILAVFGAVLSILAPDKLSALTDEISSGLVANKDNLELLSNKISENLSEDRIKDLAMQGKISPEELQKMQSNKQFSPAMIDLLFTDVEIDGVWISKDDQLKFINIMGTMETHSSAQEVYKKIDEMPESIQKIAKPFMNKEKIKKIISINLVLICILSIINLNHKSLAVISQNQNTGNITVTNIEKGIKVSLYKIASVEYDYVSNEPKEGYKWEENIQNWLNENLPKYSDSKDFYEDINNNSEKAREFYDKISSKIKSKEIKIEPYMEKTTAGNARYPVDEEELVGNAKFENVEMGTYLVIMENGYMVYMPTVVNLIPNYNNEKNEWELKDQNIVVKATNISISKTITDENKMKDNYSCKDEFTYTIKADIPTYLENSLSKEYQIIDKVDDSIIINKESLKIYGITSSGNEESINDYTLNFNAKVGEFEVTTFIADFDYNKINKYDTVKIVYNASLVQNWRLAIGSKGNNSYVRLKYANNPYNANDFKVQEMPRVTVYTYQMEIESVDKDNEKNLLPGSEFSVLDENGEVLHFKKSNDGEYYLTRSDDEASVVNVSVNANGHLYLKGLDEGTYNIKQAKAPEGYQISRKIYQMNLSDSNLDGELDEECKLVFKNSKGYILPVTGGIGNKILICIGIILAVIGIIIEISILKKKKILKESK